MSVDPDTTTKRRTRHRLPEWRIYPADEPRLHSTLFVRPKSARENGTRGTMIRSAESRRILVELAPVNGTSIQKLFDRKRLLQVFDDDCPLLLLTAETTPYRNLAWSQLMKDDKVLEIGCSTGECSKIMLRRTKNWFGIDNSPEMIETCKNVVGSDFANRTVKLDCLVAPMQTRNTILETLGEPTLVFIDIGGNRDWRSVVKVIAWINQTFHPRLVVVKSRELMAECKSEVKEIDKEKGTLGDSSWFETKLKSISNTVVLPKHALEAPCAYSPVDHTPICRYHNYFKDGCRKMGAGCTFDHDFCHLCLEKGHIALNCPTTQKLS